MAKLKLKYKHLKVVWTLPPTFQHDKYSLSSFVHHYGWQRIIANIADMGKLPMDGVAFNFLMTPVFDHKFIHCLCYLRAKKLCVWAILPNSINVLAPIEKSGLLHDMFKECDVVVLNTFGFFEQDVHAKRLLPSKECMLSQFVALRSWLHFTVKIDLSKVVVGVDTQGVMYDLEEGSPYVKRWRMVNYKQVN